MTAPLEYSLMRVLSADGAGGGEGESLWASAREPMSEPPLPPRLVSHPAEAGFAMDAGFAARLRDPSLRGRARRGKVYFSGSERVVAVLRETMTLQHYCHEVQRGREAYRLRHPATSPIKLEWRVAVRRSFHVRPDESILDPGAGSGLWTKHLTTERNGEAFIFRELANR